MLAFFPVIQSLSIRSNLLIARDDFYTQENIYLNQLNNALVLKKLLLNIEASSNAPKRYLIESIIEQPTNKFVLDAIASLMITYGYDRDTELFHFFKMLPPLGVPSDSPVVI